MSEEDSTDIDDLPTTEMTPVVGGRRCQWPPCANVEREPGEFKTCSHCGVPYCSKECQKHDWRKFHKMNCEMLGKMRAGTYEFNAGDTVGEVLRRVRMYICPFAVCKYLENGKGFLFMRTGDSPVRDMVYDSPVTEDGRLLDRTVTVAGMGLEGFDEMLKDYPGLSVVREMLEHMVEEHNPQREIVALFLSSCGFLTCCKMVLVPDYGICASLASEYDGQPMVQINYDAHFD